MKLLTAEWRHLAFLNYVVDPTLLAPHLPAGVELDSYNGEHYLSVVGLLFQKLKLLGISLPDHQSFAQINCQFYVRRKKGKGWRRGVTFLRQIIPQELTAKVGRAVGRGNYLRTPTHHEISFEGGSVDHMGRPISDGVVKYGWGEGESERLEMRTTGLPQPTGFGPQEQFLSQRLWSYTARGPRTIEMRVEHPEWFYWEAGSTSLAADPESLGAGVFAEILKAPPESAFLAKGSKVLLHLPTTFSQR